jgi:fumarate reductase subunit D
MRPPPGLEALRRRLPPSPEPFLWLLFSGGGVAAALLVPSLLFLFGLALPLGWIDPPSFEHIQSVAQNPLTRLVVFGLCVALLFHFAHRFRYTLYDGLRLKSPLVALGCYAVAALGSILVAVAVLTV